MHLGEFLREKREKRRMTIRQLAMYAGCSAGYLSMLERGVVGLRGASPAFLRKLVKPLAIPYEVLLEAAGYYIFPLEKGIEETDLLPKLCEALGWTEELFVERFGLCPEEASYIKRHGATPDTLFMIADRLIGFYTGLSPARNALLREAEWVLRKNSKEAQKLEEILQVMLEDNDGNVRF